MYTREYVDKRIVEISTKVLRHTLFRFTDIELPSRFNTIVLEIHNNIPNITLAAELRYVKKSSEIFYKIISLKKSPLQVKLKKHLIIKHINLALTRYNEIGYNDCPSFEQKYASELKPDYKIYKHLLC